MRAPWLTVIPLVALAAIAPLWARTCAGPKPRVTRVVLKPPRAPGAPFEVQVTLRNEGPGEGQSAVTARLRDPSGRTYQADAHVELRPHEETTLTLPVSAPPGDYEVEANATFPPR